ncbi:MAG TPA: hypothetical protein PKI68_01025 [Pontiellaceae bacterium]|nr:hypothetical protein [Pontiellaceae bacterium]
MDPEEIFAEEFTKPVVLPNGIATSGIFDNQSATAFDVSTTAPQVSLRQVDADLCRDGDPIWISGIEYRCKNKEYNDEGIVIVHLETV